MTSYSDTLLFGTKFTRTEELSTTPITVRECLVKCQIPWPEITFFSIEVIYDPFQVLLLENKFREISLHFYVPSKFSLKITSYLAKLS